MGRLLSRNPLCYKVYLHNTDSNQLYIILYVHYYSRNLSDHGTDNIEMKSLGEEKENTNPLLACVYIATTIA